MATHSLFLTSDPSTGEETRALNEVAFSTVLTSSEVNEVTLGASDGLSHTVRDFLMDPEKIMVGDYVKISVNTSAGLLMVKFTTITGLFTFHSSVLAGPDGLVDTHVRTIRFSNPSCVALLTGASNSNRKITVLSPRAFGNPAGEITCALPYPMIIKEIELQAYSLQNLATTEDLRPGKANGHLDGNVLTSNVDNHDYYIMEIPGLDLQNLSSNHPTADKAFAVLSAFDKSNASTVEGTTHCVYNADMGFRHYLNNPTKTQTLRVKLMDRRGDPVVCHRAHFWLKITEKSNF
jgi:hypothetical protein